MGGQTPPVTPPDVETDSIPESQHQEALRIVCLCALTLASDLVQAELLDQLQLRQGHQDPIDSAIDTRLVRSDPDFYMRLIQEIGPTHISPAPAFRARGSSYSACRLVC